MSFNLVEAPERGLYVTRFTGPASLGADRRRYTITLKADYVTLSPEEAELVARALIHDLEVKPDAM